MLGLFGYVFHSIIHTIMCVWPEGKKKIFPSFLNNFHKLFIQKILIFYLEKYIFSIFIFYIISKKNINILRIFGEWESNRS